jgi:hypothetical protein
MLRAVLISFALLTCAAAPTKQQAAGNLVQCEKLSSSFCDPQFGCQIDSQFDACYFDSSLPRAVINCTQSLIDVSIYLSLLTTNIAAKFEF